MGETVSEPVRVKAQRANDDDGWGWTIDVTAPDGARSLYQLPQALDPTDDPDAFGDALTAARTEAGMPDDADPLDDGWSLAPGRLVGRSAECQLLTLEPGSMASSSMTRR
jgi:hypothetical protein